MAASWTQLTLTMSLFILLSIVPFGSAIRCYQCSSKIENACGEVMPTGEPEANHWARKYIVDCTKANTTNLAEDVTTKQSTFCRKQHQEIEGEVRIVRSCGFVKGEKACYTTANPPTKTFVCQCETDLCNAGLNVYISPVLMSLVAIVAAARL